MKLKPQTTILFSILFVLLGIAVTMAAGLWQTESDKIPRRLYIDSLPKEAGANEQGEETQVQYDPADIRGSYSFSEISSLFHIPLSDLQKAFLLTEEEAASFQVKSLKERFTDAESEIGTASMRLFAACYLGLPYTVTEEAYLPEEAVTVLKEQGNMTAEQLAYVESHAVELP